MYLNYVVLTLNNTDMNKYIYIYIYQFTHINLFTLEFNIKNV